MLSTFRLNNLGRYCCWAVAGELAVFVTAALGLLVAGVVTWAAVYLTLVVMNAVLLTVLRQWRA